MNLVLSLLLIIYFKIQYLTIYLKNRTDKQNKRPCLILNKVVPLPLVLRFYIKSKPNYFNY